MVNESRELVMHTLYANACPTLKPLFRLIIDKLRYNGGQSYKRMSKFGFSKFKQFYLRDFMWSFGKTGNWNTNEQRKNCEGSGHGTRIQLKLMEIIRK